MLKQFAIPFSMHHVLSELSAMTLLSWLTLHGTWVMATLSYPGVIHIMTMVSFL